MLNLSHKQQARISNTVAIVAWLGIPLLIACATVKGISHYHALEVKRAADYTHAPDCGHPGYIDASMSPCTYSQATLEEVRKRDPRGGHPDHVQEVTVFELRTAAGKPLEVYLCYDYTYGSRNWLRAVHRGDTATIEHWSGAIANVVIHNTWFEADTNPYHYGGVDYGLAFGLSLVGSSIAYSLLYQFVGTLRQRLQRR